MILYNVTLNVDTDVHEDWLAWMKAIHIPDVMDTGCFKSYRICQLLRQAEEGITYSIQYICEDTKTLHFYQVNHAPELQKEHQERYGDKVLAFRSLLEVIEEG
ncbi:MAG: DUF4286 family protein [Saprospiraceae bacterium]|nr:DUF4286 family protein [Saprospiraceae bacterium]